MPTSYGPVHLALPRLLTYGCAGPDVTAVQRALKNMEFRKYDSFGFYGTGTVSQVKACQKAKGIPQSGVVGPATLDAIDEFMDLYGRSLMAAANEKYHPTTRKKIADAAYYAYRMRDSIGYAQVRPMVDMAPPPNVPNLMDCSWFATWCYKSGGAPDPNGLGYNGLGYTGTLVNRGIRTISPQIGDLAFYGWASIPSHVAVCVGNNMVVSHGSQPGPLLLPLHYRSDFTQVRSYLA